MEINRNFKDSVFTKLFNDPALLRDLYCALSGAALSPDAPVFINTLENVVFMDIYNDISFEIDGKQVVLLEYQSTINPNMALRLLMYYSRVLEKSIKGSNIYSGKRLSIPRPEFYVLYNGVKPFPDTDVYRLSDLFNEHAETGSSEKDDLLIDLTVKVININEGRNTAIVNRCRKLAEFSAFTAKARSLMNEMGNREEAIKEAVRYCHKHDILKEFLEINASEVHNMLLTEWNTEDCIAVRCEEAREDALAEGREQGLAQKKKTMRLDVRVRTVCLWRGCAGNSPSGLVASSLPVVIISACLKEDFTMIYHEFFAFLV